MNTISIIRFAFVVLLSSVSFSVMASRTQVTKRSVFVNSVLDRDSLGNDFYTKWRNSHDTLYLTQADSCFSLNFEVLEKGGKYEYAIELVNGFVKNKEPAWLIKKWYVHSINYFDFRRSTLNHGLSPYEILEAKYALVLEFTYIYSRKYGYCEDAVEVLREYKTEYSFKYIHYNRGLDKTDKIWLKLVREDQYLSWECEE